MNPAPVCYPKAVEEACEQVIRQASALGYHCSSDASETWQILPSSRATHWRLQQIDDRWVLVVNNIPQISFYPQEVIFFLKRYKPL